MYGRYRRSRGGWGFPFLFPVMILFFTHSFHLVLFALLFVLMVTIIVKAVASTTSRTGSSNASTSYYQPPYQQFYQQPYQQPYQRRINNLVMTRAIRKLHAMPIAAKICSLMSPHRSKLLMKSTSSPRLSIPNSCRQWSSSSGGC